VLESVIARPELEHVRFVLPREPVVSSWTARVNFQLETPRAAEVRRCLRRRGIAAQPGDAIANTGPDNWLVVRPLADRADAGELNADTLSTGYAPLYDAALVDAGAGDRDRWEKEFRPVLEPLAAAGLGPVVPIHLLCFASERLGGPGRPGEVRDTLVRLRLRAPTSYGTTSQTRRACR
jgi:hypothetical protein